MSSKKINNENGSNENGAHHEEIQRVPFKFVQKKPGDSWACQHWPITNFASDPLIIRTLSNTDQLALIWLNYRAWKKKDLIIVGAVDYLHLKTGLGHSTIKRALALFKRLDLVRVEKIDKHNGNSHFIEPILLGEFCWRKRPLKHLDQSHFVQMVRGGPSKFAEIASEINLMVHYGPTDGPWWTILSELARTRMVHHGPHYYFLYSLLLDSAVHHANNTSEGGEDSMDGNRGVRPSADNIEEGRQKSIAVARAQAATERLVEGENLQGSC